MLKIKDKFPQFNGKAVIGNDIKNAFIDLSNQDFNDKWLVMFFWPKDFTFVCPTEIAEFGKLNSQFEDRDAKIVGVSTDSEFTHLAWKNHKEELKNLPFPMLADIKRELSSALGIIDDEEGVCQRVTFIVDPDGIIRFIYITDLNVGRNPAEVLRVLDALQTDELCPCNWKKGDDVISI
jgi:peroxiredoxin (alkyl hydroperoxide reductase subunit C)